jgi:hypothetical protein
VASESRTSDSGPDTDADGPGDASAGLARTIVAAVLLGVGGLALGSGLVLVAGLLARAAGVLSPLVFIVMSLVLLQGVAFGGVALAYVRYRGFDWSYIGVRRPSMRDGLYTVVGFVAALSLGILGGVVVSLTGLEAGSNQAAQLGFENPEVLLLLIPASFIFIGPGEELLFRGVVQNRLREVLSPVPGIVLASVIFAAIHFLAVSGSPGARLVTVGILLFPSLVFGTVYELTDNLVVPAFIHGAYDATLFTLLYVAIKFADVQPPAGVAG